MAVINPSNSKLLSKRFLSLQQDTVEGAVKIGQYRLRQINKMASKGKGKTKNAKKEKVVEEIPLVTDEKKDEELDEKLDEVATEEGTADELEPPKEPTPPPDYDEPTLAELIVER